MSLHMRCAGIVVALFGWVCAGSVPPGGYLDDYRDMRRSMLGDYWYRVAPEHPLHRYRRLWIPALMLAPDVAPADTAAARQLAVRLRMELATRLERAHIFDAVDVADGTDVDLYLVGALTSYSGGSRAAQFFGTGAPRAQIEARLLDGASHAEVARIVAVPVEVIPQPGTLTLGEPDRYNLAYRGALAFFDFFRIERDRARKAAAR